jgi:hypothetical protein
VAETAQKPPIKPFKLSIVAPDTSQFGHALMHIDHQVGSRDDTVGLVHFAWHSAICYIERFFWPRRRISIHPYVIDGSSHPEASISQQRSKAPLRKNLEPLGMIEDYAMSI